jgi:hypothetical protein
MAIHYLSKILILSLLILSYYKYGKSFIIKQSPKIARYLLLTKYFPTSDIAGVIELALIAISHVFFCLLLVMIIPIHWPVISIQWHEIPIFFLYGVLLGIGCMGLSGLFCKIAIQIIGNLSNQHSYDLKSWLTVGRGGWIKHHLQSMEILPIYLSLTILAMQVGSEEIIFRGVIFNYFLPYGNLIAFITSLVFFILMQAFLMNRWQGAIFPMIGAAVMGFFHLIIYMRLPILWPLIVSHITFFLFAVI